MVMNPLNLIWKKPTEPRDPSTREQCGTGSTTRLLLVLACASLVVLSTSCDAPRKPGDSATTTWRFAIEESVGSVQYEYALGFKRRIEERTQGRVRVEIYPYGTLGTSTQITEQLNMGVVQFAMASPGSLGKFIPELQVFLLHFILSGDDRVNQRVLSHPELLAFFNELYQRRGLTLLAFYGEGEMVWTTKSEVRTPADLRGVKFRVMTSPILLSAYGAYGASPTPLPYSEVYSGLQLNMIDAQVNPIFAIERQKFHEVTDWLIFPGHSHFVTSAAANRPFLEKLSAEDRGLVDEVIRELDEEIFEVQRRFQYERLQVILEQSRDKGHPLHLCGDMRGFVESLGDEDRIALIERNEFLHLDPVWSESERNEFVELSRDVESVYLSIGGEQAKDALDLLRRLVREETGTHR